MMGHFIREILKTAKFMVSDNINGQMGGLIMGNGNTIRCTEKGSLLGLIAKDIKVNSNIYMLGAYVEDKKQGYGEF